MIEPNCSSKTKNNKMYKGSYIKNATTKLDTHSASIVALENIQKIVVPKMRQNDPENEREVQRIYVYIQ